VARWDSAAARHRDAQAEISLECGDARSEALVLKADKAHVEIDGLRRQVARLRVEVKP
jgi:hypothetical protein